MNWRLWLKPFVMVLYGIVICISLPFIIQEFNNKHSVTRKDAWLVGGIFVLGAVAISLWTILEHVVHYTKPYLQRHIIRILWMIPIYALNAWFAIGSRTAAIYLDTLRECYAAYVIYNFMAYLHNFLKHEYPDFWDRIEQKPEMKHLIPCCCLPKWEMGRTFISKCRHGVLQYTLVRPLTTLIAFICELAGVYHANEFRLDGAYIYLNVINNVSQVWAMYSLIMLYRGTSSELQPLKPISKFVCIKFVIFLSFWQSIIFSILTATKVISSVEAWKLTDPKEISALFQNFFICIEMFLGAIAHHFAFSVSPYRENKDNVPTRFGYSCLEMCNLSDVMKDMIDHVKHVGGVVKAKLSSSANGNGVKMSEDTPLISMVNRDCKTESHVNTEVMVTTRFNSNDDQSHLEMVESIESIGSASSINDPREPKRFLRSSLNNHLIISQCSETSSYPVTEQLEVSEEFCVNFSSPNDTLVNTFVTVKGQEPM